ncbi:MULTISPECIES: hypothetical protein [unclassified Acinetobacter]|uniref:hypothetical protein n=1 Tax=Acinetobacter TaxID=469 RepID=UPI001F4B6D15|nr:MULTISPECIES: hypothetical protein [unclassified Acinetobacter]MCH7351744.1 hypothetical protein [Acinetobacter sp. NIPH 2023]MCH7359324.1 hypothetical protein [Acinetobacter sp. NIPH 2024]
MKKLFLALGLSVLCGSTFAKANTVTVTVKKIEGFGESGDAFTFKTTSGKRYMVYNAGGASPIQGEELISSSAKSKKAVCLRLSTEQTQPRMVESVRLGQCK